LKTLAIKNLKNKSVSIILFMENQAPKIVNEIKKANNLEYGVCVECATKYNDTSHKPVVPCPICERAVCSTHSQSMLAYIPDFKRIDKVIKEAKEVIETHNANGIGHSCLPYTMDFWKRYDMEKELKRQRERNAMDGFGYVTNAEIENTSDKSLEEIRKKLEERKKQDIDSESNKPKEGFWERVKKAYSILKNGST